MDWRPLQGRSCQKGTQDRNLEVEYYAFRIKEVGSVERNNGGGLGVMEPRETRRLGRPCRKEGLEH